MQVSQCDFVWSVISKDITHSYREVPLYTEVTYVWGVLNRGVPLYTEVSSFQGFHCVYIYVYHSCIMKFTMHRICL